MTIENGEGPGVRLRKSAHPAGEGSPVIDDVPAGIPAEPPPTASRRTRRTQPFDAHLGARVRALRIAAGMTQNALAQMVGVSFQQVQKYELGKDRISAATLFGFAAALNVPVASFYEGTPQHVPVRSGTVAGDKLSAKIIVLFQRIHDDRIRKQFMALAMALAASQARGTPELADKVDT